MFCAFTELNVNVPFACSLSLVLEAYGIDMVEELLETFNKVFTKANMSSLISAHLAQSAPAPPVRGFVRGKGGYDLSNLGHQLNRIEGTLEFHYVYNTRRRDEAKHNAQKVHRKLGVQYNVFTYPTHQEFPHYDDPIEHAAAPEEEEEADDDHDDDDDGDNGNGSEDKEGEDDEDDEDDEDEDADRDDGGDGGKDQGELSGAPRGNNYNSPKRRIVMMSR